jgi:hypothetical protein
MVMVVVIVILIVCFMGAMPMMVMVVGHCSKFTMKEGLGCLIWINVDIT